MNKKLIKSTLKKSPALYKVLASVKRRVFPSRDHELRRYLAELPTKVPNPVFVKVGANDGITNDPCGETFLNDTRWSGILVEPVPYCVEKLKTVYADPERFRIEQVAVGDQPGTATFYYVSKDAKDAIPDLPHWYDQLGSFDRQHILNHLDAVLEPYIVEAPVAVKSLQQVVNDSNITQFSFLHIDTEGYDLSVLKTLDFGQSAPLAVFVEHKHLSSKDRKEMKSLLESNGYKVRNFGRDYFATHSAANEALNAN